MKKKSTKRSARSVAAGKPRRKKVGALSSRSAKAGAAALDEKTGGISDEAVRAATGRTWKQWCALLDRAGARAMDHKEIVAVLDRECPELGGWWIQMVTVGYEQARGLRVKHQTPEGYQVGASKTIDVPVSKLFAAWNDAKQRARWLADPGITIRKATPDKSLRVTWIDGKTHVDVMLYAKGSRRSQIAIQHRKLRDAAAVQRMKAYWKDNLNRLAAELARE